MWCVVCVVCGVWCVVCGVWCVVCRVFGWVCGWGVLCAMRGMRCVVCGVWYVCMCVCMSVCMCMCVSNQTTQICANPDLSNQDLRKSRLVDLFEHHKTHIKNDRGFAQIRVRYLLRFVGQ